MSGVVTLSLEIELGWGFHDLEKDSKYDHLSDGRVEETKFIERLLDLCDDVGIQFSFNVVGHLLLQECDGAHQGPHEKRWFAADPGTNADTDPLFYAPDILSQIQDAKIDHEICTHTFSHVLFDEIDSETVDWELEKVHNQHKSFGIDRPETLVPPRHQIPSEEKLRENGMHTVRTPFDGSTKPENKARSFVWILSRTPTTGPPTVKNGILKTRCPSYPCLTATHLQNGQKSPHPIFQMIPLRVRQSLQRRHMCRGLEEAIKNESPIHFWTHLYNMSNEQQWKPLSDFLEELAERHDSGDIEIQTMQELGQDHLDSRLI